MRFTEYLINEAASANDVGVLAKMLVEQCSPWFQENPQCLPVYRGLFKPPLNQVMDQAFIVPTLPNRRAMNMDRKLSADADSWFFKEFGVKYRSDHVAFVTGSEDDAASYGPTYVIVPIGTYSYCWSPEVGDLFIWSYRNNTTSEQLIPELEQASYQTTNLAGAIASGNEIMLHCQSYYAITPERYSELIGML